MMSHLARNRYLHDVSPCKKSLSVMPGCTRFDHACMQKAMTLMLGCTRFELACMQIAMMLMLQHCCVALRAAITGCLPYAYHVFYWCYKPMRIAPARLCTLAKRSCGALMAAALCCDCFNGAAATPCSVNCKGLKYLVATVLQAAMFVGAASVLRVCAGADTAAAAAAVLLLLSLPVDVCSFS
jgi:hypothetical protein